MAENVALQQSKQNKFTKQVKNIKQKVSNGLLQIQDDFKPQKHKRQYGLIYIGHLPHGFYEEEMKEYFKQFGVVTNVRVSRSRKTGKSKGFGFVQFLHPEVAQVAAETMDNYLFFNRRLVCKYIPPEKQQKSVFTKAVWSTQNYPLKISRKMHIAKRNLSQKKIVVSTKTSLKKIKMKLNKLAELGIQHTLKPCNVPDDMQHLLEGWSIDSSNSRKTVSTKLNDNIISKNDINIKMQRAKISEICQNLNSKSFKILKKNRTKKMTLPAPSFMQNDRLKRLAAAELLKGDLVNKVVKLKNKIKT
ncbi:mki67 fha domain-interacting nucleolar phosphoprotein [Holotrichia oblita]|uniref:Mki67 fha domain-interacting nucleolar phosphoprotein n=1 Tax=Holotrichia oblita TaxID=644536 RepID=A0ACB9T811_HOLOL|nr:mki67 fha domain-interacting nucleolar phosphoprotein [Holotrichia oblita]